jgi:signal transduction histidine kinase
LVLSAGARAGDIEKMSSAIEQSLAQLEVDITTLRGLITELRPAALDQLGLEPALLALVDRFRSAGLDVDVNVELAFEAGYERGRFEPELETGVYRIIQEALTNAVKHGDARRAAVELVEHQGRISVSVRDDGRGFDPTAETKGFGLLGMRERVELLNGTLTVDSAPGDGTQIRVSLPAGRVGQEPLEAPLFRLNA